MSEQDPNNGGNKGFKVKTIQEYLNQFEDEEVEQSKELREDLGETPPPKKTGRIDYTNDIEYYHSPSVDGIPYEETNFESSQETKDRFEFEDIKQSILNNPLITADNELQKSLNYSWDFNTEEFYNYSEQYWNSVWNMADEIKTQRYGGQILTAEMDIEALEAESDNYNEDGSLKPEIAEEIAGYRSDIAEYKADLEEVEKEIASRRKPTQFFEYIAQKQTEEEGTPFFDYWGSPESTKDLGGALSDAEWMATSLGAAIVGLGGTIAGTAAPVYAVPGLGEIAAIATGVAAVVGGVAAWAMRDNESYAEMYGAYEERTQALLKDWAIENGGRMPDANTVEGKAIIAEMQDKAKKGALDVFKKNKLLLAGDVGQIALAFTPWRAVGQAIRIPKMAKKWSDRLIRLGGFGTMLGTQAAIEGWEEGYQYLVKNELLEGKFDDRDPGADYLSTYFRNIEGSATFGSIEGMGQMMLSRWTGKEPYTKEFRNSVRAGAAMGLAMGAGFSQAQAMTSRAHKNYVFNKYGKEMEEFGTPQWRELLSAEQSDVRSELIFNALSKDEGKRMYQALKWLQRYNDSGGAGTVEGLNNIDFKQMKQEIKAQHYLFKQLQGKEYSHLTDKQRLSVIKANGHLMQIDRNATETINNTNKNIDKLRKEITENLPEDVKELMPAWEIYKNVKGLRKAKETVNKINPSKDKTGSKIFTKNQKKIRLENINEDLKKEEAKLKETLKNLGLKSEKEIPSFAQDEELSDLYKKKYIASLDRLISLKVRDDLNNKNNAFRILKLPYFQDQVFNEKERKKRRDAIIKQRKEFLNSVPSEDQNVKEGDIVWAADGRIKGKLVKHKNKDKSFTWLVVDEFGEEYALSELEYKNLQKREPKEDIVNDIKEKVNKKKRKNNKNKSDKTEKEFEEENPAEVTDKQKEKTKKQLKNNKKKKEEDNTPQSYDKNEGTEGYELYKIESEDEYRFHVNLDVDKRNKGRVYDFIHSRSRRQLKKLVVEYIIDPSSYEKLPAIIKDRIKEGKTITKQWIKSKSKSEKINLANMLAEGLEVKVKLTDTTKNESVITTLMGLNRESETQEATNILNLFLNVLNKHIKNPKGQLFGSISYSNFGIFNNSNIENKGRNFKLSTLFKNKKIILGYNNGEDIVDGENRWPVQSGAGRVYAIFEDIVEETLIPVKLNQRGLNEKETEVLWDIVTGLVNSTSENPFTMGMLYKDSGLTVSQYLRLLTRITKEADLSATPEEMESSGRFNQFGFKNATNNTSAYFQYADKAITRFSLSPEQINSTKSEFMQFVASNQKRATHASGFNGNIFQMPMLKDTNVESFTFLGKKYDKNNSDYNSDFIEAGNVLSTDLKIDKFGRVQENKQVVVDQNVKVGKPDDVPSVPDNSNNIDKDTDNSTPQDTSKTKDSKDFDYDEDADFDPDSEFGLFMEESEEDTSIEKEFINTEEAETWLKKVFGGKVPVKIQKGIINVGKKGIKAFGMFAKGMVTLSDKSIKGSEYHEAWHIVEESFLNSSEISILNRETIKKYGEPTKEQLSKIQDKYSTHNLTEADARRLYLQELRAEEYRNYEMTEQNKRSSLFGRASGRFYNLLEKYLIDLFRNPSSRKYYSRLSRGYYAAQQEDVNFYVTSESFKSKTEEVVLEEAGFNAKDRNEITRSLILILIDQSGDYKNIKSLKNIKVSKKILKGYLNHKIEKLQEAGDNTSAANLKIILENLNYFYNEETKEGSIIDNLSLFKLELATEAEEKNNKDVSQAMSSHFEYSQRENANINTKMLLSFFPKRDKNGNVLVDPRTSLPIIENSGKLWNILEDKLSNIVDYYNDNGDMVYAYDQMLDVIDEISKTMPTFLKLSEKIKNLGEHQQIQFFNTFSKANMDFLSAIVSKIVSGEKEDKKTRYFWEFINPVVQSKKFEIKNKWKENFKISNIYEIDENDDLIINETSKKRIRDGYKSLEESYKNKESGEIIKNKIKNLLSLIGIDISLEALDLLIASKDSEFQGIADLIKGQQKGRQKKSAWGLKDLFTQVINPKLIALENEKRKIKTDGQGWTIETPLDIATSIVNRLAEAEALVSDSYTQTTVVGPEGKTYWVYSLNNYLFKLARRVNSSEKEIENISKNSWAQSSQWVKDLADLTVRTFNNLKQKGVKDAGSSNVSMSPQQDHLLRINQLMSGIFSLPNMADKSVAYSLQGLTAIDVLGPENDGFSYNYETDRMSFGSTVKRIFRNYIADEVTRVQLVHEQLFGENKLDDNELIEYYHYTKKDKNGKPIRESANGLKFVVFPSLNDNSMLKSIGVMSETGKFIANYDQVVFEQNLDSFITDTLEARVNAEIEIAIENNIIKEVPDANFEKLGNVGIENNIIKKFQTSLNNRNIISDLKISEAVRLIMAHYTINSIANFIETTKVLSGDPAYYKNLDDLAKRLPELIAPGQDLKLIKGKEFFNVAVIEDYIVDESKYYKNYLKEYMKRGMSQAEAKEKLAPYKGVNVTDAQAYITLSRWKDLKTMLGEWDSSYDDKYLRLSNPEKYGEPTLEDLNMVLAQPLKGMYFGMREGIKDENGNTNSSIPTYLKYSQAVLIPSLVKNRELSKVLDLMNKNKVDELVFESGIKVGAKSPTKIHKDGTLGDVLEDATLNSFKLENRNWKLQQKLDPHTKSMQLEGSQLKKNIIGNIDQKAMYTVPTFVEGGIQNYEKISGRELIKKVHEIDRTLSNEQRLSLEEEWGINYIGQESNGDPVYTITNIEKIQKILLKAFKGKASSDINTFKALELEKRNGKVDWKYPLDSNPKNEEIQNMLSSLITKRTVKLEMPGGSYIQMSNFGYQKISKFTELDSASKAELLKTVGESKLQPAYMSKDGVVRAQIFLPSWFKDVPALKGLSGKALSNKIKDKRLLRAIGYRIPNQGMSSIDSFEVVGFLPKHMGDTVVAYDEITSKTGSDFDIDKLYVMLPSYGVNKNGDYFYVEYNGHQSVEENKKARRKDKGLFIKALRNRKLQLYDAILTSPNTFIQLTSPLDSVALKNDAAMVRYLENKNNLTSEQISEIEGSMGTPDFYSTVSNIASNLQDLEWFSGKHQMHLKETFLGGQAGVGQTANHLVDHMISQWSFDESLESPLFMTDFNFLLGNTTENNNTDLSRIFTRNSLNMISDILSARLDAYVDIAKDPYIFYINNNTITANTVFMMDRMGVDPTWTNSLMSVPIIKEFVKYEKFLRGTSEGIQIPGSTKQIFTSEEIQNRLIENLKESVRLDRNMAITNIESKKNIAIADLSSPESLAKYYARKEYRIFKDFENTQAYQEALKKIENGELKIDDVITIKNLYDIIDTSKQSNPYDQLVLFKLFLSLKDKAAKLNKIVSASKADTKGAGKGIIGSIISKNLIQQAEEDNTFSGFEQRFENTMLGAYQKNGPEFMYHLFKNNFILGNIDIENSLYEIGNVVGNEYKMKTNEEFLQKTFNNFKTYLFSKTPYWKSIDVESLLYGDNSISHRLHYYQTDEKSTIKNNALVKYLTPVFPQTYNGYSYITSPATAKKDGNEKTGLINAWEELFNSKDPKIKEFSEDLYKISIIQSGLQSTLHNFYELAPFDLITETELFQQFGIQVDAIKRMGFNDEFTGEAPIIDFLRGQTGNLDFVPDGTSDFKTTTFEYKGETKNANFKKLPIALELQSNKLSKYIATPASKSDHLMGFDIYTPLIEYTFKNKSYVYEHVGYKSDKKTPVYALTERLGRYDQGKVLYESPGKRSVIKDNIVSILDNPNIKEKVISNAYTFSRAHAIDRNRELVELSIYGVKKEDIISPEGERVIERIDQKIDSNSILDPNYELPNPFYAIIQSIDGALKHSKFNTISEAILNGVSVEEAINSAIKYNLELRNHLKETTVEEFKYTPDYNEEEINNKFKGYDYHINNAINMIKDDSLVDMINLQEGALYESALFNEERMISIPNNSTPAITILDMIEGEFGGNNLFSAVYNMVRKTVADNPIEVMVIPKDSTMLPKLVGGEYDFDKKQERGEYKANIVLIKEKGGIKYIGVATLHELLHKFTLRGIDDTTTNGTKFKKQIRTLFNMLKQEEAKGKVEIPKQILNAETERIQLAEFITYGLTNEKFIKTLKRITVTDSKGNIKSLWEQFKDAILKYFNIKETDTAYDLLFRSVEDFIENNVSLQESLKDDLSVRNKMIEKYFKTRLSKLEKIEDISRQPNKKCN